MGGLREGGRRDGRIEEGWAKTRDDGGRMGEVKGGGMKGGVQEKKSLEIMKVWGKEEKRKDVVKGTRLVGE